MSNFSTLDSIFECSNLSATGNSLCTNSALESVTGFSPQKGNPVGNSTVASLANADPLSLKVVESCPSSADLEQGRLKVKLRFEVLSQISNLLSILSAIDVKYGHLARMPFSEDIPQSRGNEEVASVASSENMPPKVSGKVDDNGSSLVEFLLDEFRSGVDTVEEFITSLDRKYEIASIALAERVHRLTEENESLRTEMKRLRPMY